MPEKLIIKNYIAETKAVEGKRVLHATITTDTPDRDGDIVEPKGIKLINYRKNNAVLFGHDYRGLPIAKGENLEKTEHGIIADVVFPDEGIYPLADTVYNMGRLGFIKAWSIGFIPLKTEDIVDEDDKEKDSESMRRKGRRIKSSELLEFSACAVGCNPDTLTNMIAKGINIEPLKEAGFIEIEDSKEIILKPEETEEYIRIPNPKDKGNHEGHRIRTIDISKDEGIKAIYCGECKIIMTYLFEKSKGWTMVKAKKWVEDHSKFIVLISNEPELTAVEDKTANEIYEIVKKNKELEEKVDKLELEKKDLELKAGAVLNKKNKTDLKDAQTKIQSVLDSAEPIEENSLEIEDVKDNKGDDTGIDIEDNVKDDKGIDEAKLEEIIEKKFEESNKSIKEHFNKKLNYIMGRVK